MTDKDFMKRAIELALKGQGWTNPNPLVGAVIVKEKKIIGQGFHHKYGQLHAERDALENCLSLGNSPKGAVMYVTLEPCCHFGKQPPCCRALVESGIKKVFVGSRDPNPLVSGKGNSYLIENGIEVVTDFMKEECDALNEIFFYYITHKKPYIALKYAMTADGKIATFSGKSRWISNEESRKYVHTLRNKYFAILCGIGTVLKDDPLLSCRIDIQKSEDVINSSVELYGTRNPVRIICDTQIKIPLDCKIVKTAQNIRTILACSKNCFNENKNKVEELKSFGIEMLPLDEKINADGKKIIDFYMLMNELGKLNIDSVLVEGGSEINFSALQSGLVNKVYAFVCSKIFGGKNALSPVGGSGVDEVKDAFEMEVKNIFTFKNDLMIEYNILKNKM